MVFGNTTDPAFPEGSPGPGDSQDIPVFPRPRPNKKNIKHGPISLKTSHLHISQQKTWQFFLRTIHQRRRRSCGACGLPAGRSRAPQRSRRHSTASRGTWAIRVPPRSTAPQHRLQRKGIVRGGFCCYPLRRSCAAYPSCNGFLHLYQIEL